MELRRHGLHIYPLDPSGLFIYPNGDSLRFWHDHERIDEEIALMSPRDRGAWQKWMEFWEDAARLFQRYFLVEPPTFDEVAIDVAGTKYEAVWERLLNVPVRAMAESCFEDPRIAAAAIGSGDYGAISEPGSALAQTYFKMSFLTADEDLGIVRGGMGGITQAMARSAREAGVTLRTEAPVDSVIVSDGRAAGVRLETGEEIGADFVVSNADPKSTFTRLVDERALPPGFPRKGAGNVHPLGIVEAARRSQAVARLFEISSSRRRRVASLHGPDNADAQLHRVELARRHERDADPLPDHAVANTNGLRPNPRSGRPARHVHLGNLRTRVPARRLVAGYQAGRPETPCWTNSSAICRTCGTASRSGTSSRRPTSESGWA